jgi:large subunit ribosomal protein L6
MSRIGKMKIVIPSGVDVKLDGQLVSVKGAKGTLSRKIHDSMEIKKEAGVLTVVPRKLSTETKRYFGLTRTLVNNMVVGTSAGFTKNLTLIGVGYRAAAKGNELQLTLGFSHPVIYMVPAGITVIVEKQTMISISGSDKELVGQVAADIRSFRKPEPYHGKGVRYSDEVIVTKVGKAAAKK